jgi:hypothetical protein
LRLEMANSMGGEARNQFRSRDRCIEPAMVRVDVLYVYGQAARPSGGGWEIPRLRENERWKERKRERLKAEACCVRRGADVVSLETTTRNPRLQFFWLASFFYFFQFLFI